MMCIVNLGMPMYFMNGCTPSNSLFNHNEHKLDVMSVGGVHLSCVEISRTAGDHISHL